MHVSIETKWRFEAQLPEGLDRADAIELRQLEAAWETQLALAVGCASPACRLDFIAHPLVAALLQSRQARRNLGSSNSSVDLDFTATLTIRDDVLPNDMGGDVAGLSDMVNDALIAWMDVDAATLAAQLNMTGVTGATLNEQPRAHKHRRPGFAITASVSTAVAPAVVTTTAFATAIGATERTAAAPCPHLRLHRRRCDMHGQR